MFKIIRSNLVFTKHNDMMTMSNLSGGKVSTLGEKGKLRIKKLLIVSKYIRLELV